VNLGIVLDGLKNYESFFGGNISGVNKTIQMMVLYDPPPAEWLRGIRRLEDLPRIQQGAGYACVIPHPLVAQSEIALRAKWIVENCHAGWNMTARGFGFELEKEAVYFRCFWD
jgi:hypothetical protein